MAATERAHIRARLRCREPDQIEAALAKVKARFGALDALVNNAGIAVFKPALDTTLAEFQRTMDVNLTGPFLLVKAAAPLMGTGARS